MLFKANNMNIMLKLLYENYTEGAKKMCTHVKKGEAKGDMRA